MANRSADALDQALRARGHRSTLQRRLVLEAVAELGHGTPEQVCERVQRDAPSLSPSTVYRTLELLENLGVVSHTHLGHGAPTYHLSGHDDHLHLVCRRCGGVQEADVPLAGALAQEVADRYGFVTDMAHLSLDGVCAPCSADAADKAAPADTAALVGKHPTPSGR